ncbi:Glycosyl hydrolase, five-bladed beta-propellor domain superfamily [Fusarium oxysporum f. sp. vasinfectum]|nr:Glycosyl hydrolase, five-bladed beta-propellor domain superfamily [Fusarium oxysporum f. sp. vasinfectum]
MTAQQQSLESLLGISGQRKSLKQQLDAASIKTEAGRTTLADLPTVQIGCKEYIPEEYIANKNRKGRRSWIQAHGFFLTEVSPDLRTLQTYWVCSKCDERGKSSLFVATNTTSPIEHLRRSHMITEADDNADEDSYSSRADIHPPRSGVAWSLLLQDRIVREFFEQHYPREEQPETSRTVTGKAVRQDEPSQFDQWMQSCDRCMMEEEDELGVYMRQGPVRRENLNPVLWWKDHQEEYPRLSKFALDILAIPAMSVDPERTFSVTKLTRWLRQIQLPQHLQNIQQIQTKHIIMFKFFVSGLAAFAMASAVNAQYPNPRPVSGNTFTHDPTLVKTPSGGYLMAFTANGVGLKSSTDRTNWRDTGAAFPNGAPWTTMYTKGDLNLWAPDISYHNGKYMMYYSASSFGSRNSAIFLATSTTGASGSWTNQGEVIRSSDNDNYNAIDGNLIVDTDGKWWLSFGSFWGGLKLIELDPSTGKRKGTDMTSIAARPNNGGELEAPFITKCGNYYYLWVSFDRCCKGKDSTYRIMVGRATNIKGPYVDKSGKQMMQGGGTQIMAAHD